MKKIEFLNKIMAARVCIADATDGNHRFVKILDSIIDEAKDLQGVFTEDELSPAQERYRKLIRDNFDVTRLSTKRVTATQLCNIFGLDQTKANQANIAIALRAETGAKKFRSGGVVYNNLPFNKDGSIEELT